MISRYPSSLSEDVNSENVDYKHIKYILIKTVIGSVKALCLIYNSECLLRAIELLLSVEGVVTSWNTLL